MIKLTCAHNIGLTLTKKDWTNHLMTTTMNKLYHVLYQTLSIVSKTLLVLEQHWRLDILLGYVFQISAPMKKTCVLTSNHGRFGHCRHWSSSQGLCIIHHDNACRVFKSRFLLFHLQIVYHNILWEGSSNINIVHITWKPCIVFQTYHMIKYDPQGHYVTNLYTLHQCLIW